MKIAIELTLDQCSRDILLLYKAYNILSTYPSVEVTLTLEGQRSVIEVVKKLLASGGLDPQEHVG